MLTMYSTSNCPWCLRAEELMKRHNVEYEKINVEEDKEAREFLMHSALKTVPQIFYDDERIGGYEDLVDYLT